MALMVTPLMIDDSCTIDDSCSGYLFWCQPPANVSLTNKSTLGLELSSLLAILLLLSCRSCHNNDDKNGDDGCDDGDDDNDDDQGCASVHLLTGLVNLLGNLEELVVRDVAEVPHPYFYSICLHIYHFNFQVTIHPMLYASKGQSRNLGARVDTFEISRTQHLEVPLAH